MSTEHSQYYPEVELEVTPEAIGLLAASLGPAFEGFMSLHDAPLRYLAAFSNLVEGQKYLLSGHYGLEDGVRRKNTDLGRGLAELGLTSSKHPEKVVTGALLAGRQRLTHQLMSRYGLGRQDFEYRTTPEIIKGRDLRSELERSVPALSAMSDSEFTSTLGTLLTRLAAPPEQMRVFRMYYGLDGEVASGTEIFKSLAEGGIILNRPNSVPGIASNIFHRVVRIFRAYTRLSKII